MNAQGKRLISFTVIAVVCVVAMAVLPYAAASRVGVALMIGIFGLGQVLLICDIVMAIPRFLGRKRAERSSDRS